jgi:hypothetical protein
MHGEKLVPEQRDWLYKLNAQCRADFSRPELKWLRPLRDAGLVRAYPKGFLSEATAVEITGLGRMWVDAAQREKTKEPRAKGNE